MGGNIFVAEDCWWPRAVFGIRFVGRPIRRVRLSFPPRDKRIRRDTRRDERRDFILL